MHWIISLIITIIGFLINISIVNRQINSTLKTKNRQDWVTETRNVISELLTQAKNFYIEKKENKNLDKLNKINKKIIKSKIKLFLLLNSKDCNHKKLKCEVIKLLNFFPMDSKTFDDKEFKNQIKYLIQISSDLLYKEWGKIQNI